MLTFAHRSEASSAPSMCPELIRLERIESLESIAVGSFENSPDTSEEIQ
jgi:hypothetical protein